MKPSPSASGTLPPGRLIDPRSSDQRESAICAAVADLITNDDVEAALAVLRRGLKATTTIRAPKTKEAPMTNNYMIVDDVPTQLAAARLLFAYKYGNPASVVEMKLSAPRSDRKPATREEMLAALQRSGTDINAIIGTWVGAAKQVEETGALPPELQQQIKAVEGLTILDV